MDHRADAVSGRRPILRRLAGLVSVVRRLPIGPILIVLACLEVLWLQWFLVVPLVNVQNIGVVVRRGVLLLKAFPEVVPDTTFHDSLMGRAADELIHVENLPQRLPIVLAAGLIAAAAIAAGSLVRRSLRLQGHTTLGARIALDYGVGAALLGIATLIVGRLGWLDPWLFRIGLAAIAGGGFVIARPWQSKRRGQTGSAGSSTLAPDQQAGASAPPSDPVAWLAGLAIVPFLLVMILASMLPTIDFDVLEYHLQGPKEYFQLGRIAFLPHNVYTNMPFGVEMLHLMGMEVLGDWWWGALAGQLLVALFAPATAVLIATTAGWASTRAGWIAALVFLSTPWIYRLAAIAYVEGPLCFYHAALVWAVARFWYGPEPMQARHWGLLGIFAGCAMACKYPALISAVIPFGVLALVAAVRRRSPLPLLAYCVGWAALAGPWLVKNVMDTGDPVYPLGYRIFHGRHWDAAMEQKWRAGHSRRPVSAGELWNSVVDVAGRSDWQSPLYAALAPLAFLRSGSRRMAFALWAYVIYLFLTWWLLTHRVDRFWLPLLPLLAVLAGIGADWTRQRAWSIMAGCIVTVGLLCNFVYVTTALAGLNEWTRDLNFLRRDVPRRLNRPLSAMDASLPASARILLVGQASVFHVNHAVVYNTVFNKETIELLAEGQDAAGLRRALHARGLTHIYVDWKEIKRHRQLGGYGFTAFVTPERFAAWVDSGVLERPTQVGSEQELYRVR
jgi:hypothetical protein